MNRLAWIAAPLAAVSFFWIVSTGTSRAAPAQQANCNAWVHEPLVAFDVTGATLAGPIDSSLHVYNDGTVKFFSQSQGRAEVVFVPPPVARDLALDLLLAGASSLCDDPATGSDIPLRTLTVFRGASDAVTHTINWFGGNPPYDALDQVIDAFVTTHVP